ncbi:aminopeptidase [soil metagenome]
MRYLSLLLLVLLTAACSPGYVLRAGYEEAKILRRRQPITRLVADPRTPPEQRAKLGLVLEARAFAERELKLDVGDSYTTFSQLDSDTLALVLSAAHQDRFAPHTWWFPIVGRVPYKGFFSEARARREIAKLEQRGLDTYLRPTSAFSTLGWFNDPLVSSLLRYDSVSLANTVVHELFHNTLYVPGQAAFNESLANFVGSRGAIQFFCARDTRLCEQARNEWQDELLFGGFLSEVVRELEALYARTDLDRAGKLVAREEVFTRARRMFAEEIRPRFQGRGVGSFERLPLNNATLISRRLYYQRLDLFEQVFARNQHNLQHTITQIVGVSKGSRDPYAAVEQLISQGAI